MAPPMPALPVVDSSPAVLLQPLMCCDDKDSLLWVDLEGRLNICDTRSQLKDLLLQGSGLQEGKAVEGLALDPQPPACLEVSKLCLSSDGNLAVAAGKRTEDSELLRIAVLDLHGKRYQLQQTELQQMTCTAEVVDDHGFASRPGLQVLQISFHPGSSEHFLVLTSDNMLRLYHVHSLESPEQRFELQPNQKRALGISGLPQRQAAAFAFGPPTGWLYFTVFILCSDGAVFGVCPVAPFGSTLPLQDAHRLMTDAAAASSPSLAQSTTSLWLQQAFATPSFAASAFASDGLSPEASPQPAREVHVRPHALDHQVPGLLGPLPVSTCDDSAAEESDGDADWEDPACSLLVLGYGEACTVLLTASASGTISAYLLATSPEPAWTHSSPQCITHHGSITAVRSEIPLVRSSAWPLLLLDRITLPDCEAECCEEGAEAVGAPVRLFRDPAMPDRVLCCTTRRAFSVTLPWIPILASCLAEDDPSWDTLARLPVPQVLQLQSRRQIQHKGRLTAAAAVGNALTGSAIAVLDDSGKLDFLSHPRAPRAKAQVQASPTASPATSLALSPSQQPNQEALIDDRITARYRDLVAGPPQPSLPQAGSTARPSAPEGQAYLSASIEALRTSQVVYQHKTHLGLTQRLEELQEAMQEQEAQLQEALEVQGAVAAAQEQLVQRLEHCSRLQTNLHARVRLLAELHWDLPHALSPAETKLQSTHLPQLEQLGKALASDVQGLRKRMESLGVGKDGAQLPGQGRSSTSPIAPVQMRRIRAALSDQAELLAAARQALSRLEQLH